MVLTQLYCSGDKLINTSNDWKGEVDKTFQKTRVKEFDTVGYIKKAAYFYKILKSEGKEEDNVKKFLFLDFTTQHLNNNLKRAIWRWWCI